MSFITKHPLSKCLVLVLVLVIGGFIHLLTANAMNFSVRSILPDNQRGQGKSYFDLLMEPGSSQIIEVEIENIKNSPQEYHLAITPASTNPSGNVSYQLQSNYQDDETLLFDSSEILDYDSSIVVAGNSTKIIPITVHMPEERFNGLLAFGISLTQVNSSGHEHKPEERSGVNILHEYAFAIALLMRQNEIIIAPDLTLLNVAAGSRNDNNIIAAHLQNPEAMFINNIKASASVTKKGEATVLFQNTATLMQMAPNSNFEYAIPLAGEAFTPGEYTLQLEMDAENGHWLFEEDFIITQTQAQELNQQDVTITNFTIWPYLLIALASAALITLVILFIIRHRKRQQAAQAELLQLKQELESLKK